ncbi:UNC5C-like protein [Asterias rubens]|uniref:UNC5C-like protein n=1 Tax=Asterias rubens TaxID=7604 RepID=UPI0014556A12|nr:UNC5C-like protein [Asterias rubens]
MVDTLVSHYKETLKVNTHPAHKDITVDMDQLYVPIFFGGISEVVKSVEEQTTHSQLSTYKEFTLLEKKDFLKSFESMLEKAKAQSIDVVGKIFQIGNFAAAVLDCRGGCLSIDDLHVHLCVPPGAIPEEQTQQVYIYVTGTSSVENHHFSTPFVHCGPPDTVFHKDVVLTMPHCVKNTSSCKFSLSKLSSDGSSDKLREGFDVITVVDNDSITFSVNHFCGFGATASPVDGTILKKTMIACLFIHEDSHSEDLVRFRLRLVDDVKVNVLEVRTEEERHGFYQADVDSPLIVLKNDQDVVAKISDCAESWELSEPERKIHRDLLWRETKASCARAIPSAMFIAKRRSGCRKVCFTAHMTVLQEGSGVYGVNFFVYAKKERIQQPALDRETQMDRIQQMFLEQMARLQCTSVRPRLLEESIFNKLCDLFDDPNPLGNDWRNLATLLLNRSVSTDSISDKAGRERRSPTEIVFELFVGRQSGRTEEETRATLMGALIDMDRQDAEFAIVAIRDSDEIVR